MSYEAERAASDRWDDPEGAERELAAFEADQREDPPTASMFDPEEEPPCFDDDEPVVEPHDIEILMSGESHTPVALLCSCGQRFQVVPE